jgi:hypothetical protein
MRYIANPIIVTAFKIEKTQELDDPVIRDSLLLYLDSGDKALATKEMMARMTPQAGDYLVIQEDGYIYLNPKDVFERKYSPL